MLYPSVDLFSRQDDLIGEGPLWSEQERALYWIDIGKKRLHRKTLAGISSFWDLPSRPGCVVKLRANTLALTLEGGVHSLEPDSGSLKCVRQICLDRGVRFNEGKVDPRGRFWFGSMQDNFGPDGEPVQVVESRGSLFRLDSLQYLHTLETEIGISNTLAWSPDSRTMYFADSLIGQIFLYDYDVGSGSISNRRIFFDTPHFGLPDGSAIDTDGCLWNARWGAGVILRITPDGQIDRQIKVPALQPSSCAFGGSNLECLFVTSARNGMTIRDVEQTPLSGSVFAIKGIAQGLAVPELNDTAISVAP